MPAQADSWDIATYDRYRAERQQPFYDLLALVEIAPGWRVADLGCGTGELTSRLHRGLAAEATLGLDSSAHMLATAANYAGGGLSFELGDIAEFSAEAEYDLLFSNAALHWLPDHMALLERLWRALKPGGQLAVQLPANQPHPTQVAAVEIAAREPYAAALAGHSVAPGALAVERYAEVLHALGAAKQHVRLQVYAHELPDETHAFTWIRGSLLTGYEAALGPELYPRFEAAYRARLFELIPPSAPYLLTYRRILIWARKWNGE